MRRATALSVPVRRLSRSISSHVGEIHFSNVRRSQKLLKNYKTSYFESLKSFAVIDVNTLKSSSLFLCLSVTGFTLNERIAVK